MLLEDLSDLSQKFPLPTIKWIRAFWLNFMLTVVTTEFSPPWMEVHLLVLLTYGNFHRPARFNRLEAQRFSLQFPIWRYFVSSMVYSAVLTTRIPLLLQSGKNERSPMQLTLHRTS